jgi:hypothetical protein
VASGFDLVVAAARFGAVDALVRAMRAVDARAARFGRECVCEEPAATTLSPTEPAARFEPRQVIHPTPRYEPRPVIHPTPRFEPCKTRRCCPGPIVVIKPPAELPLQPPWKTVPWKEPPPPVQKVKLACYHPDNNRKGMLLDSFI